MQELNLPKYEFRFELRNHQNYIFDSVRRKFILCTPEEWVRQNLIRYFIAEKKIPSGLISIEKEIKINQLSRRYDLMIANQLGKPAVLVECKAPKIKITQDVFQQIASYNLHFKVPYLFVSNGIQHYICQIDKNQNILFLKDMPDFSKLNEI